MRPIPSNTVCDDAAGGVVRPIPNNTVCDDAAGGVIRPIPSNTATSPNPSLCKLASATSTRDISATIYGPRINSTRMAPNRIVNWHDLKSTVDMHLGKCNDCKGSGMYLAEKSTCSFATTLEVVCKKCNEDKDVNRLEISYLKKKITILKPQQKRRGTTYVLCS